MSIESTAEANAVSPEKTATPPAERTPNTNSGLDAAWEGEGEEEQDGDNSGEGEADFDIPEEAKPAGLGVLARRNLDDDAAYALHPDVALMRAEKLAAELGVEVALVLRAIGR